MEHAPATCLYTLWLAGEGFLICLSAACYAQLQVLPEGGNGYSYSMLHPRYDDIHCPLIDWLYYYWNVQHCSRSISGDKTAVWPEISMHNNRLVNLVSDRTGFGWTALSVGSGWGVVVVCITAMQTAATQVVFSSLQRWEKIEQHRHNPCSLCPV